MTSFPFAALHSHSKVYVIRLKPHDDLKYSLQTFAREKKLQAAILLTCVGSLEQYNLRFANQKNSVSCKGHFEIVSLVGTLSETSCHIHVSISDHQGITTGGHLMENNLVFTTAEVAIAALTDLTFERVADPTYGYHELHIRSARHEGE